jgi:hypothetical protein
MSMAQPTNEERRIWALNAAVAHHAREHVVRSAVLETARQFESYLRSGDTPR